MKKAAPWLIGAAVLAGGIFVGYQVWSQVNANQQKLQQDSSDVQSGLYAAGGGLGLLALALFLL